MTTDKWQLIKIFSDFFTGEIQNLGEEMMKAYALCLFNFVLTAGMCGDKLNNNDRFMNYIYCSSNDVSKLQNLDIHFKDTEVRWPNTAA